MSTDAATFSSQSGSAQSKEDVNLLRSFPVSINRLLISEVAEKGTEHCMKYTSESLNVV
jgi:hypothetical protein